MTGPTAKRRASTRRRQLIADRDVYRAVDTRDGHCCRVCGIFCGHSIHRHHIVFRSLGGETALDNVISLCQKHHEAAHGRSTRDARIPVSDLQRLTELDLSTQSA